MALVGCPYLCRLPLSAADLSYRLAAAGSCWRRSPCCRCSGDSDFSNDSWQAHETYSNANTEQRDRLLAALAAWMQYMPLDWGDVGYDRAIAISPASKLYRNFRFGNLLNLMLTEQRLQRTDHAIPEAVAHAAESARLGR